MVCDPLGFSRLPRFLCHCRKPAPLAAVSVQADCREPRPRDSATEQGLSATEWQGGHMDARFTSREGGSSAERCCSDQRQGHSSWQVRLSLLHTCQLKLRAPAAVYTRHLATMAGIQGDCLLACRHCGGKPLSNCIWAELTAVGGTPAQCSRRRMKGCDCSWNVRNKELSAL